MATADGNMDGPPTKKAKIGGGDVGKRDFTFIKKTCYKAAKSDVIIVILQNRNVVMGGIFNHFKDQSFFV